MSGELRKEIILERLNRDQRVSVAQLSTELGVCGETVRRDLRLLAAEGVVRRVHGGAIRAAQVADTPITERVRHNPLEKDRVAALAHRMISDDCAIFLDTGTTTLALARRLTGFRRLRLYTNSVRIAQAACTHFGVQVQMMPGRLRPTEQDLVGSETIAYIHQFHFDMAFLGIAAVNADHGFMDFEEDEARIRQALIGRCARSIILADHSKFGKLGNVITAPFDRIGTFVTDVAPPGALATAARACRLEIVHG